MSHGGARIGAGRPEGKTAPPTRVLRARVPLWAVGPLDKELLDKGATWSAFVSELVEDAAKRAGVKRPAAYKAARKVAPRKPRKTSPRAPQCDPSQPACHLTLYGAQCSIEAPLFVPAKEGQGLERITARYCLTEISELLTSHRPGSWGETPGYPKDAQERDYKLPAEQFKVETIARDYEPSLIFNTAPGALDGLPVANEQKVILGGNGRTMATFLRYQVDDLPKKYLLAHSKDFGFTKKQIAAYAYPMVVRTMHTAEDAKTLAAWSRRLNTSLSQQLDSVRLAVSRAKFVDERVIRELSAMRDDETLIQFLSDRRSEEFVKALQASGVIDQRSASAYLYEGLLNQQGRELVSQLLVALLLPDADQIAALGTGAVETLAKSAVYLLKTKTLGAYSLIEPLRLAVKDYLAMRAANFATVRDFLRQTSLFGGAVTAQNPLARRVLAVFNEASNAPVKFSRFSRKYFELAKAPGEGQSALFASESYTPVQAVEVAAKDANIKIESVGRRALPTPKKKQTAKGRKGKK